MSVAGSFDLSGHTALVTGASSGIGRAVAQALARAGASIAAVARRADKLDETVDLIGEAGGRAQAFVVDLTPEQNYGELVGNITRSLGTPDILLNCAGVNLRQPYAEITPQSWKTTVDLNLAVPFFLARALVPGMQQQGWGRVINIASLQTRRAFPDSIPYGASKGGLEQLTRAMAEAWSRYGINCNAIAPGFVPTDLTRAVFEDDARRQWAAQQTMMGRNSTLEDLHGIAIFLASKASDYITGQTIFVDGGFTAR